MKIKRKQEEINSGLDAVSAGDNKEVWRDVA